MAGAAASYTYGLWPLGVRAGITEVAYAPGHRAVVFVPARVEPASPRPVLLLFDPGGDAEFIVNRYAKGAAQHGWIAASSFEVRNGTADAADTETLMALLQYIREHHAVDESRVFSGGFSGGACGAYRLAIVRPEVSGAIVECGQMSSWREVGASARSSLSFYLFTRTEDMNRVATNNLLEAMQAKGCRVTKVEREGGHAPMSPAEVPEAMNWMVS